MKKQIWITSIVSSGITLLGFFAIAGNSNQVKAPVPSVVTVPSQQVSHPKAQIPSIDFRGAASNSLNAVVHIKTSALKEGGYQYNPLGEFFYGSPYQKRPDQMVSGSGSGVIISHDGYIATNHHVIKGADEIDVTLNDKRTYKAKVIGKDPNTDLALLKIDSEDLPMISYGNSDQVSVGEWVLAVGNPFNLTSTVTAGIVSAKGRDINILKEQYAIESFIQTDAAVNPGNSGGALVNVNGELVGINTAIASNTGSYTGYSFAVPVNVVKKVMTDLREYGTVQRALLGVQIKEITSEMAQTEKLNSMKGAYVSRVIDGTAADIAGVEAGDVITKVNATSIDNPTKLLEVVGQFGPGDKVKLTVNRGGEEKELQVTLKNKMGTTSKVNKNVLFLGAEFEAPTSEEKENLGIEGGVKIKSLEKGILSKQGMKKDFIITHIDNKKVNSPDDAIRLLKNKKGGVLIQGKYPNGQTAYYGFGL